MRTQNFRKGYCLGEIGAVPLPALGSENLISSASRVLFFGVAWMTTRSPIASSPSFAGLAPLLSLDRQTVHETYFTSTDLPSAVFISTESALIFSTVPRR